MPIEMFLLFWKLFLLLYSTNLISVTKLINRLTILVFDTYLYIIILFFLIL